MIPLLRRVAPDRTSFRCVLRLVAAVLLLAGAPVCLQAQSAHPSSLVAVSRPVLVDCAPVSLSPCVSAQFTPGDANGAPVPVSLPAPAQLPGAFTITGAAGQSVPFFASSGSGPDAAQHTNLVLLLVDISGSMNDPMGSGGTRFQAAKGAIAQFLQGMQDGSDRIAIVPFESHNVVSTIHAAVFASRRSDALAQLNALPAPNPKNNTALYQAVFSGVGALQSEIGVLEHEGTRRQDLQPHLIVMTDGKNEVMAGDDAQLLNGDLGLQQATAQVQASHLDTIGIGFGDRSAIDTAALQRMSSRFFYAGDANQLLEALHVSRTATSHSVTVTWLLPEDNRSALMGRDPAWTATLRLPDGSVLASPVVRLLTPATSSPVYDRAATAEELRALMATHPSPTAGWSVVLVHGLLYLLAAAMLLLLWFWVPRLIWADRFSGSVPAQRWSSERSNRDRPGERSGVTSVSGVKVRTNGNLPTGFSPEVQAGGPLQRSAAQTTQIQPRGEFSKTRLSFD